MIKWITRLFRREVRITLDKSKLTPGEAGELGKLNQETMQGCKAALEKLLRKYTSEIIESHLYEGKIDIQSIVMKMQSIIPAVEKADRHNGKQKQKQKQKKV